MKSIANMSSYRAYAMSGANLDAWVAVPRLLLTRPHISAPGVSGKPRTQR